MGKNSVITFLCTGDDRLFEMFFSLSGLLKILTRKGDLHRTTERPYSQSTDFGIGVPDETLLAPPLRND